MCLRPRTEHTRVDGFYSPFVMFWRLIEGLRPRPLRLHLEVEPDSCLLDAEARSTHGSARTVIQASGKQAESFVLDLVLIIKGF